MAEKKTTATKKTTAKKPATKKAASTSKSVAAPAKKQTAKKQAPAQSTKTQKEAESFMTVRVTHQTVYWLLIGLSVLTLGLWILKVQQEVMAIYDQIELINLTEPALPPETEQPAQETPADVEQ